MQNSYSVSEFEALATIDPHVKGLLKRKTASTFEVFVSQLNEDIDEGIQQIERSRHLLVDAGEDLITNQLVTFLNGRYYDAEHDTQHGGHVDIIVKHQFGRFEWLGEAKLWKGPAYIAGGWGQLNTRYSTGTVGDNHGGMLLYIKQPDAKSKLDSWKLHIEEEQEFSKSQIDEHNELRLNTTHTHPSSGLDYHVRHMAVVLNHANSKET